MTAAARQTGGKEEAVRQAVSCQHNKAETVKEEGEGLG